MANLNFQHKFIQSLVSHDPSEICEFGDQETFLISYFINIINVENSCCLKSPWNKKKRQFFFFLRNTEVFIIHFLSLQILLFFYSCALVIFNQNNIPFPMQRHLFSSLMMFTVHDMVSQKEFDPRLPPLPPLPYIEKEEDSIKIVCLVKNQEPLVGAYGGPLKTIFSPRIFFVPRPGLLNGLLHHGLLVCLLCHGFLVCLLRHVAPNCLIRHGSHLKGAVTFKVIPGTKEEALFHYNPQADPAIPCKDAGLEFWRGDVLQIVSQEDDTWWQARQHNDANLRAGLIPSRQLQESILLKLITCNVKLIDFVFSFPTAGLRKSFRLSRKDNTSQQVRQKMGEGHASIHLPIYQEVLPYKRKPDEPYRLVLLSGPSGVGVTELKRRLLLSDPEHFSLTVPYTTREQKKHEREGEEYYFVSKHTFEKYIFNHKFLEYGEYKGNYYSMSLNSVRRVIAESKLCLLDVKPHVTLYTSEFKPYVVFVKPPSIERLRLSRRNAKVLSSQNEQAPTKIFTEEDFQDMITSAQAMENKYGHLFENVIINDDLAMAFTELRIKLAKIETETHWIPNTWAHV
uniref:Membrane protein, palmitoylated 7b (MAGUK p55 subfamily member 7) n=1 Tax=Sinocyclocheilus rhinocerous TaxID=307959 RepID=A0A673KEH1_9TELE